MLPPAVVSMMSSSPRKHPPKRLTSRSMSMTHAKESELTKAFKMADVDGTGRLTENEYLTMYRSQEL